MITAIVIISLVLAPERYEVFFQAGVGGAAIILSYYLLQKGKLDAAGWAVVILGWLILTLDLALISGIRGVNVLGQVLIVMFAGLAINGKAAIYITFINLIANLIILYLERNGILAQPTPLPADITRWFIQTIYTCLAAVYIWRADSVIKRGLLKSQTTADRYRALFERTNDGVIIFDLSWCVLSANAQASDLLDYSLEDMNGVVFSTWDASDDPDVLNRYKDQILGESDIPVFEHNLRKKDGLEIPVEMSLALVPDADGDPHHIQCVFRDITQRKEYERQLKHMALHDPLTKLPNRKYFDDRYQLTRSQPFEEDSLVAVLFIDIDDFKLVNDAYGHAVGDLVLVELGARLQASVRESDTVARVGGDEFLMILDNVHNKANVSLIAQKVVDCISQPYKIDGHQIRITVSIGISLTEKQHLLDVDLIKSSDLAMYQVKEMGKNDFRFIEPVLEA
jgi:diguanylate cyclase (GGDEF)-like protein/PAS domain S-box-containing protein